MSSKQNLLKNPNADDGMKFWEMDNGGLGWSVQKMPPSCGGMSGCCGTMYGYHHYFQTPPKMPLKHQVIDLLGIGFTRDELDKQPLVKIEDWFSGWTDSVCGYEITVCLLDDNKRVLQRFKPKPITLDPAIRNCAWQKIEYSFSDYGPGLRYISFENGGKEIQPKTGVNGVKVTASSVVID